uniref:Core protein n=1 Tax=Hepatitis B virus TaxID=10407 RepID=A0A8F3HTI5_HBV|nr:MAG: core protein [Hepatitis B virus]
MFMSFKGIYTIGCTMPLVFRSQIVLLLCLTFEPVFFKPLNGSALGIAGEMSNTVAPDPYLEFGLDNRLIDILPQDFFPTAEDLVNLILAQFGDGLDSSSHLSPHYTALRQVLVCYFGWKELMEKLDPGTLIEPLRSAIRQIQTHGNTVDGLRVRKALWFHWASLTFGDHTVKDFIISFATWIRTPAAYRPVNAPILTVLGATPARNQIRGRSSAPARKSRSPSPRRKSPRRSPSPGRKS